MEFIQMNILIDVIALKYRFGIIAEEAGGDIEKTKLGRN